MVTHSWALVSSCEASRCGVAACVDICNITVTSRRVVHVHVVSSPQLLSIPRAVAFILPVLNSLIVVGQYLAQCRLMHPTTHRDCRYASTLSAAVVALDDGTLSATCEWTTPTTTPTTTATSTATTTPTSTTTTTPTSTATTTATTTLPTRGRIHCATFASSGGGVVKYFAVDDEATCNAQTVRYKSIHVFLSHNCLCMPAPPLSAHVQARGR